MQLACGGASVSAGAARVLAHGGIASRSVARLLLECAVTVVSQSALGQLGVAWSGADPAPDRRACALLE
ncbi:MAG: hypothetical protein O3C51_07635 [Planctomycetota bacterium]|nr:hypothetical protein [Planctomycetota bacterium]